VLTFILAADILDVVAVICVYPGQIPECGLGAGRCEIGDEF
jgi:hypothetical protein